MAKPAAGTTLKSCRGQTKRDEDTVGRGFDKGNAVIIQTRPSAGSPLRLTATSSVHVAADR